MVVLSSFRSVRYPLITVKKTPRYFSTKHSSVMKVLNVAEKNDAAKSLAAIMSRGASNRREGLSPYNKIYQFGYMLNGQQVDMIMTSVSGHLQSADFTGQYRGWRSCSPVALFDAPIHHFVPDRYLNIKKTLEREARGARKLIIWTDCDREGENIGFEIIDVVKAVTPNIQVLRARFSEITPAAVGRAVANLQPPDVLQNAAVEVRRELDLRIGAAFTRFLTLRYQVAFPNLLSEMLISYGSCQFPALGFVVERYNQIAQFVPEPFWKLKATLEEGEKSVDFAWRRVRLFDYDAVRALYDMCIENPVAVVIEVKKKRKSKWRPQALDTVEFEKNMCRKLKISAKEAMTIAERLYTKGFISYPRTETNIFPKDFNLQELVQNQTPDPQWGGFAENMLQEGITPRNGNKSDQAHPPIHPLKYTDTLNGTDKRVYEFIVRHFLACCSKDAQGFETTAEIDIANEKFFATGLVITARNYLDVYPYEKWSDKDMPDFTEGDRYQPSSIQITDGSTSAPNLLTEADLIALMEKHGIGTDATHAEHIETIKERCYVGVQPDGKFVPGELGMGLVQGYDALGFEFSKPHLRAGLEDDLKQICDGQKLPEDVLKDQVQKYKELFEASIANVEKIDEQMKKFLGNMGDAAAIEQALQAQQVQVVRKCPNCGSDMSLRQKKNNGQSGGYYIGCLGYPQCKSAMWLPDSMLEAKVLQEHCAKCGPDVKKMSVKWKRNSVPSSIPQDYTGCIMCDQDLKNIMDMRITQPKTQPTQTHNNQRRNTVNTTSQQKRKDNSQTVNSQKKQRDSAQNQQNVLQKKPPQNSNNRQMHTRTADQVQNFTNGQPRTTPGINDQSENVPMCNCNQPAALLTTRKEGPNQGRPFHRCSKGQGEGSCNFFSWADDKPPSEKTTPRPNQSSRQAQGDITSSVDSFKCECGEYAVSRIVSKEGKNKGREFYTCSKGRDSGCSFFKWTDELTQDTGAAHGRGGGFPSNDRGAGGRGRGRGSSTGNTGSKRKCGQCRQEGHNKKNCPQLQ